MIPDYQIAIAAGLDAGNRNMNANNRKAWNLDDWNASCDTFNKIMEVIEPSTTSQPVETQTPAPTV